MASAAAAAPTTPAKAGVPKTVLPATTTSLAHLSGPMKAALWLLSVEESLAVGTMGLLSNEEVMRLRRTVDNIKKVSPDELTEIHG